MTSHVDDFKIITAAPMDTQWLKDSLSVWFEMKDQSHMTHYLGMVFSFHFIRFCDPWEFRILSNILPLILALYLLPSTSVTVAFPLVSLLFKVGRTGSVQLYDQDIHSRQPHAPLIHIL